MQRKDRTLNVSRKNSFKLLINPEGELPDLQSHGQQYKDTDPSSPTNEINYHNNTKITNNTNIIFVDGHICKINTNVHSPPEIIQASTKGEPNCFALRKGSKSVTKGCANIKHKIMQVSKKSIN